MVRIKTIDENRARGRIKELYDKILLKESRVPGVLKIFSIRADFLELMIELYNTLMGKSKLPVELKNYIALSVSIVNSCDYCYESYFYALKQLGKTDEEIDRIIKNFAESDLDKKT
ncbi:MAG: carboxymuconolactone decarboxylase family protein, partial [Candidatus Jordarchaeum sp.]|uniref:carboxymuconolactone decarboxylase family protein n=1 Tax=Candidatus Jordarchaeum sp. TaxID=2823881 RepID=UPI00404B51B2